MENIAMSAISEQMPGISEQIMSMNFDNLSIVTFGLFLVAAGITVAKFIDWIFRKRNSLHDVIDKRIDVKHKSLNKRVLDLEETDSQQTELLNTLNISIAIMKDKVNKIDDINNLVREMAGTQSETLQLLRSKQ